MGGSAGAIPVNMIMKNTWYNNRVLIRKFLHFTIPSILSMLAFSIYTMVDGMFVAKGVGEKALAAVNLSSPYNAAMFACGLMIAVGMSTVIAIRLGLGEHEEASRLFSQNLAVSAAAALAITAVTLFNLERVALFLGATPDTLAYVKEYVGTIAPFAVFFICAYNMEVLVKTDGAPQISVIGVALAGISNVVLDWLFVMKFGWGVRGAAFATGLAQILSVALYVLYFARHSKNLHFTRFAWNLKIYRRTLPLGAADGITEFSNGIVVFLFNRTILGLLGEDGVVCYTVVGYINTFILMMMSGTAQGMQPIASFYFGRKDRASYEGLLKMGLTMGILFGAAGWVVCRFFGAGLVALFIRPESVLFDAGVAAVRNYAWAFPLMGLNVVSAAFFTSIGRASRSFPISAGRGLVFPAAAILLLPMALGADMVWYAGAAAEAACLVVTAVFMAGYVLG